MADQARAVFATRDDVYHIAVDGIDTAQLLAPADTAGRSATQEIGCAPGATIDPIGEGGAHRYVFVLASNWTITVDGAERTCVADTMIQLPAGTAASARVTGEEAGKLLVVAIPVGRGATL